MKTNKMFLVSYVPLDKIDEILTCKSSQLVSFAYILHNKDVYLEDVVRDGVVVHHKGDKEIDHCHIYLNLKMSREPVEIINWFKCIDESSGLHINTLAEKVMACQSAIDYLTHKNSPEKYQYPVSDVHYGGSNIKEDDNGNLVSLDNTLDDSYDIVECMLNGMPLKQIVRIFGKDFVYHYSSYKALMSDMLIEDSNIKDIDNDYEDLFNKCDYLFKENQKLKDEIINLRTGFLDSAENTPSISSKWWDK